MKFKTTLLLFGIFILLFAAVYFFEFRSQGKENEDDMLISFASEDVEKIIFKNDGQTIQFQRKEEEWLITDPIEAKADKYEVNMLADDFSNLRIERVVEEESSDLKKYGIPQKEIELYTKGQDIPIKIQIGMQNPLDNTFFAKKVEEKRVVLISSSLKSLLEKKVFDFRQKDIFKFESDRTFQWSAGWRFTLTNKLRVNNDGFISSIDYDPGARGPLVAVIGDSYVEALMVPYQETGQGRLMEALEDQARVYSFAIRGSPLSQYLAFAEYARDKYRPDAMVFVIVGNDFDESLLAYKEEPGYFCF